MLWNVLEQQMADLGSTKQINVLEKMTRDQSGLSVTWLRSGRGRAGRTGWPGEVSGSGQITLSF